MWDLLRMLASLVLVLGLLVGLLWGLRKLQSRIQKVGPAQRSLKVIDSLHLGPRHKITLIEVDHRRIVVGISGQHMTALAEWPEATPANSAERIEDRA